MRTTGNGSLCSGPLAVGTRDAAENFLPLPPGGLLLPWEAASYTLEVAASNSCAWNAASLDSGLSLVDGMSGKAGQGNGSVTFTTNTVTAKRVGYLLIAGQIVTVTQLDLRGSCTSNITVQPLGADSALAGVLFSTTVTASGGTAPYNLSTASPLPDGLTLSSNGVLSGTPTQTGSFSLVLRASDAQGCQNTVNYTLTVSCPPLTLRPDNLPDATQGSPYAQALAAAPAGGNTYAVIARSLPARLRLNAQTGVLSGTPTAKYSNRFTVQASGAGGCGQAREYKLKVK